MVFQYQMIKCERVMIGVHSGPRKWVYETFQSKLKEVEI